MWQIPWKLTIQLCGEDSDNMQCIKWDQWDTSQHRLYQDADFKHDQPSRKMRQLVGILGGYYQQKMCQLVGIIGGKPWAATAHQVLSSSLDFPIRLNLANDKSPKLAVRSRHLLDAVKKYFHVNYSPVHPWGGHSNNSVVHMHDQRSTKKKKGLLFEAKQNVPIFEKKGPFWFFKEGCQPWISEIYRPL